MAIGYSIDIEEKVYINGVEFEDLNMCNLLEMRDDVNEERRRLAVMETQLCDMIRKKQETES